MEIFKYIFFLGIIYIVFSIIWFFIALLPKYILGNKVASTQNLVLNYIIKIAQYYFLASLTAIKALDFITQENIKQEQVPLYVVVGGIVLYLYLAGKVERSKMMFQLKTNFSNTKSGNSLKYEPHLVGLTIILYAISFNFLSIIQNPVNEWFLASIDDFYNTIIIGWIIGFIGFFFLISMVFKGINVTGYLIQTVIALLTGKPAPKRKTKNPFGKFGNMGNNNPFGGNNPFQNPENNFSENEPEDLEVDDDMYVDFEVMDEDEEENKNEE